MKKLISIGFALFFSGCHPVPAMELQVDSVTDCGDNAVIIVTEDDLKLVLTESQYLDLIIEDDGVFYEDLLNDENEGLE